MPQADPTPLVSIQIPTYNRPDYVALSLRSAMEQTYENLEIIVSDDASPTDEIEAVVREVGAGDDRVRYLRQPVNLGGLGNFIAAFQASRGEYLKCLCDDDLLHPRHVEELVRPLVEDPRLTLAFSYFDHIDEHGRRLPDPPGYGRWSETPTALSGVEIARTSLATNQNLVGSTTATLFSRRRVALPHIMRYGGVEISHYVTDWAMWLSLLAAGPVFYSPEALSQTREHPDRVTHRSSHIFDRVNDLLLVQEHWAAHADDIERPAKLQALNMIIGMSLQLATAHVDAPEASGVLQVAERALGHVQRLQAGDASARIAVAHRVSIVLAAGGDAAGLTRQIEAIIANTSPDQFDVVLVVDSTATDGVRELLAQLVGDVVVVERDGELDAAEMWAAGAAAATHEVVVLLEPTALVQPGWLPRLLDCFVDEGVRVGCSEVVVDARGTLASDPNAGDDGDWSAYDLRDIDAARIGAIAVRGAARERVAADGSWDAEERVSINPASWVRMDVAPV